MKLRIHFRLKDPSNKAKKEKYLDLSDCFAGDPVEDQEDTGWYHADVDLKPSLLFYRKDEAQCFRANGFIAELSSRLTCRLLDAVGFAGKKIKDDKDYYLTVCRSHVSMKKIRDTIDYISIDLYEDEINDKEVSSYLNFKLRKRTEDEFYSYWAEVI